MAYSRILPFPDATKFVFPELDALCAVWTEKKSELDETGVLVDFLKKLKREWAVETGIIERLYTWDRGVTEVLIEQGIEASIIAHKAGITRDDAEHIEKIIGDQLGIVEGLFSYIKGDDLLSEHFIRGLQAQFTAHQDYTDALTPDGKVTKIKLLKGEYKLHPNNPKRPDGTMHLYCPPEFTKEEMEKLVYTYNEQSISHSTVLKAAWLHHRFTQIHPFQDGNGRVARAIATLVFLKDGYFPLIIRESDREQYIFALESADSGDLLPLAAMFARRQREAILKALGLEQQVQQSRYADQIIASAMQVLEGKYATARAKINVVYKHADKVVAIANSRLSEIGTSLSSQLRSVTPPSKGDDYHAWHSHALNNSEKRHYFQKQIVDIANHYDYYANFEPYRAWSRLSISTQQTLDFVLSVHGYGSTDNGILAVSGFTYVKAQREEGGTDIVDLRAASPDLFQFNYKESVESIEKRFKEWLEASLAIALAEWKRTLQS